MRSLLLAAALRERRLMPILQTIAPQPRRWRNGSGKNEVLRALYSHVAAEPVPPRLDVNLIARDGRIGGGSWGRMAAAAVLLLATGMAAGWYGRALGLTGPVQVTLVHEAMEAHQVYSSEVVHPVEVWAGEKEHLQAWLSKRLARTLLVPDLRTGGLTLVGGRLLPAENGPAAPFMYEDDTRHRVTLYILPAETGRETSLRYANLDPLEAFFWTGEAISCALVGDLPRERLREIATQVYNQLG